MLRHNHVRKLAFCVVAQEIVQQHRNGCAARTSCPTRQVRAGHPGNFLAPSPTEVWLGRSDPAQQEHEILGTPATLQVISKHDVAPATTLRQAAELLKKHTFSTTSCGIFSMPPVRPGRIFTSVIAASSYFPAASSCELYKSHRTLCRLEHFLPCVEKYSRGKVTAEF